MAISNRLTRYLIKSDLRYQIVPHLLSDNTVNTSIHVNVPLAQIAKAVLLIDQLGRKLMAVIPASNKINLDALNEALQGTYSLMDEEDVIDLFQDCEKGAVPALADAYHLNLVYEETLDDLECLYIEAGDHKTLLKFDHENFEQVVESGKHIHFSYEYYH